jgi:hypothetical protein
MLERALILREVRVYFAMCQEESILTYLSILGFGFLIFEMGN